MKSALELKFRFEPIPWPWQTCRRFPS